MYDNPRFRRETPKNAKSQWTMVETITLLKIVFICLCIALVLYILSVLLYLAYNHWKEKSYDNEEEHEIITVQDQIGQKQSEIMAKSDIQSCLMPEESSVTKGLNLPEADNLRYFGVIDDEEAMKKEDDVEATKRVKTNTSKNNLKF